VPHTEHDLVSGSADVAQAVVSVASVALTGSWEAILTVPVSLQQSEQCRQHDSSGLFVAGAVCQPILYAGGQVI